MPRRDKNRSYTKFCHEKKIPLIGLLWIANLLMIAGIETPLARHTPHGAERCPACGAAVPGGRAGCQALWDELNARAYNDLDYAAVHDLAFDAYCMQHLETYCRSAKSYAAHLTRLCCGLEYDGSPAAYAAIQKWLNGPTPVEKPETLADLGRLTIADVATTTSGAARASGAEYRELVRAWAESVWTAYATQHELARAWIRAALGD
jgi:hypothetical protein